MTSGTILSLDAKLSYESGIATLCWLKYSKITTSFHAEYFRIRQKSFFVKKAYRRDQTHK